MAYKGYTDVRGEAAKPFSVAMGIDEPSQFSHTGYLVEIRQADDHVRLSAHAATYAREVLIYNDRSLEIIDLDDLAKEARKTVMKPDGTVTSLTAPWSKASNGYMGAYKVTETQVGQVDRVNAEWEKYDNVLMGAEVKAREAEEKLGLMPTKPEGNGNQRPPRGLIV